MVASWKLQQTSTGMSLHPRWAISIPNILKIFVGSTLLQLEEEERKKGILTCYLSPVNWQILPLVLFKADKIAREYSTMQ